MTTLVEAPHGDRCAFVCGQNTAKPPHRLGVLFVHGIGEQPEGDTAVVVYLERADN